MFGSLGLAEMVVIAGIVLHAIGTEKLMRFANTVMQAYCEILTQFEEAQRESTKSATFNSPDQIAKNVIIVPLVLLFLVILDIVLRGSPS